MNARPETVVAANVGSDWIGSKVSLTVDGATRFGTLTDFYRDTKPYEPDPTKLVVASVTAFVGGEILTLSPLCQVTRKIENDE